MKKLQAVEPFAFTYRVIDRYTMFWDCDYNSLKAVFKVFGNWHEKYSDGYLNKIDSSMVAGDRHFWHPERPENKGRYAIVRVQDGYTLTKEEIKIESAKYPRPSKYERRNNKHHNRDADLMLVGNNPKKLKSAYAAKFRPAHFGRMGYWHDDSYSSCDNMSLNSRGVKTTQEIRLNNATQQDYRNEYHRLVRMARNDLPTRYDDPQNRAWHSRKSWKHHSKREKQWIPKGPL